MIIKMLLVADPLLVPADGVQVGGGGVGRPAEHLQYQRVELLHVHVVISGVKSSLIIIPTEPDTVLVVRAGAELLPEVGVHAPGGPVVVSLEDLVVLQHPVALLRDVGPQDTRRYLAVADWGEELP